MGDTIYSRLVQHPLLAGLPLGAIEGFVPGARDVEFGRGDLVLTEGAPAGTLFLLEHGKVALSTHAPGKGHLLVQTLGPGEVLGLSWLFPPFQWKFDARAIEPVTTIALEGAYVRAKLDEDPALGYEMLKRVMPVVLERLQQTRFRLLDLYGKAPADVSTHA
ncbi:MAG TPA: cyclic nucleotide-binding domain-containing protein [Acidimicrobiales bacterium]|nr:cyclic nucleotide-binding domain-containing protein [Acidimicrobiales bacterium]